MVSIAWDSGLDTLYRRLDGKVVPGRMPNVTGGLGGTGGNEMTTLATLNALNGSALMHAFFLGQMSLSKLHGFLNCFDTLDCKRDRRGFKLVNGS